MSSSQEANERVFYPEILAVLADYFRLSEFEKICLFQNYEDLEKEEQDSDPDGGYAEPVFDFPEESNFERADSFYLFIIYNKILTELVMDDRLFVLLSADYLQLSPKNILLIQAFAATLNAYEDYSKQVLAGLYENLVDDPDATNLLALVYALDFIITGTSMGDTFCIREENGLLPKLHAQSDVEIIDRVEEVISFLKPHALLLEIELEEYPDHLISY